MDDKLAVILIVGCTFGLFGLVVLWGGIKIIISNRKFARTALVANGVVVGLETSSGKSGLLYSPVVEFVEHDGKKIHFVSNTYQSDCQYEEGDQVQVFYDQDFDRMELADNFAGGQGVLLPLVLVLFGGLFLAITIGIILMETI
jgi:hypothetical protein